MTAQRVIRKGIDVASCLVEIAGSRGFGLGGLATKRFDVLCERGAGASQHGKAAGDAVTVFAACRSGLLHYQP